ncbi:hypothetical protein IMSHALPRED_005295 [Imshaugia aleurites]|uniref:Uncharacterized protein n=1 Tax=Imshaugia aleurites TaxID=172621 RepID=A0A8H3FJ75_9LECA|nr:hypothetical protein IMSHALPRED_005295 [Imshaugia aleurites]
MLDVTSYLGDVILCIVLYLCVATIAKVPSVQDPWLLLIQCICVALLTQLVFGIVKERRALRVERDGGWASIKLAQQQVESVLKSANRVMENAEEHFKSLEAAVEHLEKRHKLGEEKS